MSRTPTTAVLRRPLGWRAGARAGWDGLSDAAQGWVKTAVLMGSVVAAYHYSLLSLLQTVGFDTPLAYVGLVPLLAVGLAWLRRSPPVSEPDIHDRQLDYIIGVPLVGVALVLDYVLPAHMGDMYWVDRVDLLSLPIFVAGVVALVFGTRTLWRQKVAVLYLLLAWPWPYTTILLGTLGGFTSVTVAGLNLLLRVVPVARAVPGTAGQGLYEVFHHGHAFPVSVVTACSGVDGMVGFLLVGAGFATLVVGPLTRKLLWLATGLVLLWVTNLLRLVAIFGLGKLAGEHLAIGVVHPVLGVVVFCLGVVLMMALLGPFGLRLIDQRQRRPAGEAFARARRAAPRAFLSIALVAVLGGVLSVDNSGLRQYDPVASASGEPRLGSFLAHPAAPSGWRATFAEEFTNNKPLFGEDSIWWRYTYAATGGSTDLHADAPIYADVIDARGLGGFEQYGIEACYSFHGYDLADVARVSLGEGITGQALSWSSPDLAQDWTVVYWIWPVATRTGTRYERVVLQLSNTLGEDISPPAHVKGITGLPGALNASDPQDHRLLTNREFLVAFAREVVAGQTRIHDTGTDVLTLAVPAGAY